MLKRRAKKNIPLPWEGKLGVLREVFSGRRWRIVLGVMIGGATLFLLYGLFDRQARVRATYAAIEKVKHAIYNYRLQHGACPSSTVALFSSGHLPGRTFTAVPTDGWGRELMVVCPSPNDELGVEVFSAGPSGSFFEDDNVY